MIAQRIVDILLETGEPDQDYDHEPWDEIVRQLEVAGIHGAYHREFDKYQGVYLNVPHVDKFWPDPENEYPNQLQLCGHNGCFTVDIFKVGDKLYVNAESLVDYCKKIAVQKAAQQSSRDVVDKYLKNRHH